MSFGVTQLGRVPGDDRPHQLHGPGRDRRRHRNLVATLKPGERGFLTAIAPGPALREDYLAFTQIRLHLCWGSWHGPHTTDIELKHILKTVLGANVGQISFEAANARHEHEWAVWDEQRDLIPDDLILVPGVVSHATNLVEHPDLVAQRIERFAKIVGPERVIAATDCGLGGRVHPQIAWAKLESLGEGARRARV